MALEFDDAEHYGFFLSGTTLTSQTGHYVRMSSLVLAALRSAGVFDTMEDGTDPPATDKLWLDKNFDPPVLKEWDSVGASWEPMTYDRFIGRQTIIPLTVTGGTANSLVVAAPALFQENKLYSVMPSASNTDAVTIQVTGYGTFGVKYPNGSDVADTEFYTGRPAIMIFQNGRFELLIGSAGQVASEVAQAAAEAATLSAAAASDSETAAAGSASAASGSASAAALSATAASGSATTASGAATAAEGYRDDASGFATAASGSASSAASSASSAIAAKDLAETARDQAQAAAGSVQPVGTQIAAASSDNTFDDTDELGYVTGSTLKRGTFSGLISSLFNGTRAIANGVFLAASFAWQNAGGFRRTHDISGHTANRATNWPDGPVTIPAGTLAATTDVIGVSQTWQNVSGSRVQGTTYQNTTGKPIMVCTRPSSSGGTAQVSVNGSTWISLITGTGGSHQAFGAFIVPDNWYYRVANLTGAAYIWVELRA